MYAACFMRLSMNRQRYKAVDHRFFKVDVAMPDGATPTDAIGPVGGGNATP